jgi:hypothetical protein
MTHHNIATSAVYINITFWLQVSTSSLANLTPFSTCFRFVPKKIPGRGLISIVGQTPPLVQEEAPFQNTKRSRKVLKTKLNSMV